MGLPSQIGRFRVERLLGSGAMGSVLLARDAHGRSVAIKVLNDRDPEVAARFRREAELMARVQDPGVVAVLEAGVQEGQPFLVMDYVPGRDLAGLLKERGALAPAEAARLVAQVARAVAAAHAAGVVHRDLKPANVLVGEDGRPRVTDFGISARSSPAWAHSLTETGVILGTPAYMAPEQVQDARAVDARSDVYSLGVILRECLTGQPVFVGASGLAILNAVLEGRAAPLPSGLPPEVVEVVETAMAGDPGDRYSSAGFMADALEDLGRASGRSARRAPPVLFVGALGLVLGGVVAALYLDSQAAEPPGASPSAPRVSPSSSAPAASPGASGSASPSPPGAAIEGWGGPNSARFFRERLRFWSAGPEVLREAVAAGNPAAMTRFAVAGLTGEPGAPSRSESERLLRRAAEEGDPEAMCALGNLLGRGGAGRSWLRRAAEARFPPAMSSLGREFGSRAEIQAVAEGLAAAGDPSSHGFLVSLAVEAGDRATALARADAAVEAGVDSVRAVRGRLLRNSPQPQLARSFEDMRRAAEAGVSSGRSGLARAYALGLGVERDPARARAEIAALRAAGLDRLAEVEEFFLLESRRERSAALVAFEGRELPFYVQAELGLRLLELDPTPEAKVHAGRLLARSRPLSNLDARVPVELAFLILGGHAPGDGPSPLQLFERGAALGDARGLRGMGSCYLLGRSGVGEDTSRSLELFRRAGEAGDPEAWERLGSLYLGRGSVEKDEAEALACFVRAAEGGFQRGMELASELYARQGEAEQAARWAIAAAASAAGRPPEAFDYARALRYLTQEAIREGERAAAERLAERGVNEGDPWAVALSARLERSAIDPDFSKVAARFKAAAEGGDPEGQLGYARCLAEARGVARDLAAAARLREQARPRLPLPTRIEDLVAAFAAEKWVEGLEHLRFLLELEEERLEGRHWADLGRVLWAARDRLPNSQNVHFATARLFSRAEPQLSLDPRVAYMTADHMGAGHIPVRTRERQEFLVASLYRRSASLGYAPAYRAYGRCLISGYGVPPNFDEGVRMLKVAAAAGSSRAYEALGDAYRSLRGGPDLERAESYYRQGAEVGLGSCSVKLADLLYRRGDHVDGLAWTKKAISQGDVRGEILLAESILQGRGLPAEPERGLALLKALAREHRLACKSLAEAYRAGAGVTPNLEEAARWERRADALPLTRD